MTDGDSQDGSPDVSAIKALLARSSLGSPVATAIRALTPPWKVAEILRRHYRLRQEGHEQEQAGAREGEGGLTGK